MRGAWPSFGVAKFALFEPAAVLRLGVDRIAARAAGAEVVHLEISGSFGEAVAVQPVVEDVVQVEQVGHRGHLIDAGRRVGAADSR